MIDLDDAKRRILSALTALAPVWVDLDDAPGRILRESIHSAWPLPVHDHAAMDGYGLRAADSEAATVDAPVRLAVVGVAAPGHDAPAPISRGQALRIFTGASIPPGVDCVIRQEAVSREGQELLLRAPVACGNDIRRRGEDLAAGVPIVEAGVEIDEDMVMALASFGHARVRVSPRPRVAIVTSGDELVSVAQAEPGRVVDVAGPTLAAACRALGADAARFGPAADLPESLRATVELARADGPDMLLTVGGASVGDRDLAAPVLDSLGMRWLFSRVAIKPGKPTGFGHLGALPVFMLPGNPGAALVVFRELVAPALGALQGRRSPPGSRPRRAALVDAFPRDSARATVVQVEVGEVGGRLRVERGHGQSASRVSPTLRANASFVVPAGDRPLQPGTLVEVALRRAPRRRPTPPVLAFIGSSNSGKTTLLAAVVGRLAGELQLGVIKHGRHFELDRPGKDSARYREAGARAVVLGGPDLTALIERAPEPAGFAQLCARLPDDLDIILVEGFKYEGLPSVEVHRRGRPLLCSEPGFEHVLAVVTDAPELVPAGRASHGHHELDAVVALVRQAIERHPSIEPAEG